MADGSTYGRDSRRASAPEQPLAPQPAPTVSAQSEAPATDETDGADSSARSPEESLNLETLVTRVEERIRGLHAASAEIGELLGRLADQSRAASATQPIGRQQADRTVRLLNQTLSRLRRLPELMEEMTEPI